jgi:hypothetical protein
MHLTPAQWAEQLGYIAKANPNLPQQERHAKWEHAAADRLFGWSEHAFNYQAPADRFEITEEAYLEALRIAGVYPLEAPNLEALPPSQLERFADFQPRAKSGDAEENS